MKYKEDMDAVRVLTIELDKSRLADTIKCADKLLKKCEELAATTQEWLKQAVILSLCDECKDDQEVLLVVICL